MTHKNIRSRILLPILLMALLMLLSACSGTPASPAATTAPAKQIVVGFSQVGAESDWRNANTQSMLEALS